jgi:hypothetical protein
MGSFSWNKADKLTSTENVAYGTPFKFLIPKEFGGEPKYDMYELLAFWNNAEDLKFEGEYPRMKQIDEHTDYNRGKGIDIGCYDKDILQLKYPLKLVSASFKGTYEDLKTCSLGDPDQGFFPRRRRN